MVRSVGKTGQLDQEGTTVPITVIFTDLIEILTNPNTRDPVLGRIGIGMAVLSPAVVLLDITRTIATVEIAPLLSLNSGRSKDDTQQERDETKRLLQHDVYLLVHLADHYRSQRSSTYLDNHPIAQTTNVSRKNDPIQHATTTNRTLRSYSCRSSTVVSTRYPLTRDAANHSRYAFSTSCSFVHLSPSAYLFATRCRYRAAA